MDAPRFDALTRCLTLGLSRRRGLALLTTVGLRGLVDPDAAAAKKRNKKRCPPCKKRKKDKCKGTLPDGTPCPGGACQGGACRADPCPGQKPCEGGCIPANQCCTADDCPQGFSCCDGVCTDLLRAAGAICDDQSQCCSNYCQVIRPGEARCAVTCRGSVCLLDRDCCRGFPCLPVAGLRFCGGCGDVGAPCEADADCCFSACTQLLGATAKSCASFPGGPCTRSANCRSCSSGGNCTVTVNGTPREICENGVCGCPDDFDCCSNFDCDLDETCVFVIDGGDLNGECRPILPGP